MDKKEIRNIVFDVAKFIGYVLILLFFFGLIAIIYLAPDSPSAKGTKDDRFQVSNYMVDGGKIKVITDTQTNCEYLLFDGKPLPLNLRSCK